MSDIAAMEALARQFALEAGWTFHDVRAIDPGPKARAAAESIVAALRAAGFELYRLDDMAEVWWCLTHLLPGDRDLNDPDAIRRRCFAHRINWELPLWTQLKCRMVRRTWLVPVGGDS